ncbi:3-hydroxyacyl-CoA dehydrogenase [Streptosporangium album]|uniref:3-hydroxyacyl-CoA dehydrogenase n=1 Tax=Streptosporangium album TaxID=47479 RepID=A0A7W7WE25_9ACTN|nr:3-hydroxyacyl-CoA dehydrogenase [Streptosporangium album]
MADLDLKISLSAEIDGTVKRPDAILASSTPSIPIARLAQATGRLAQVVGLHFFNPVSVHPPATAR